MHWVVIGHCWTQELDDWQRLVGHVDCDWGEQDDQDPEDTVVKVNFLIVGLPVEHVVCDLQDRNDGNENAKQDLVQLVKH